MTPQWDTTPQIDLSQFRAENELHPELLSITSLNPWPGHTSSPRGVMFSQHIGQCLQIKNPTPRRCQTGTEREFAKATFKIVTPNVPIKVIDVIRRFEPNFGGIDRVRENHQWTLIYEEQGPDRRTVGAIPLISYSTALDSMHQHFGFRYRYHIDPDSLLGTNGIIPPNTVIADSPAVDDEGNYRYGIESNVAQMTIPGVTEDGIVVRRGYLKNLISKGFERRQVSWGKEYYPLNLYGDRDHYKPFPDVGERINATGPLFCLRRYDPMLAPLDMRPDRLEQPDYTYDRLIYGTPGAKVVDVTVYHNEFSNQVSPTPEGMDTQTLKYYNQLKHYHTRIRQTYERLHNRSNITPQFHTMVRHAYAVTPTPEIPKPTLTYRGVPIDDYWVEVCYEYDVIPDLGFKLTTCDGNKGVNK